MMQAARVVSSNSSSGLCGIGPQNEIGKRGAPRPAEERGRCAAEKVKLARLIAYSSRSVT